MKILAVDTDALQLNILCDAVKNAFPAAQIFSFSDLRPARDFISENAFDVAFLDVEVLESDGLGFAKEIKAKKEKSNIVFVAKSYGYAEEAFLLHASGYILKPVNAEKIKSELANLRYPVNQKDIKLKAICFGEFDVFYDGKPLVFSRGKTLELLALLIDRRGGRLTANEICCYLFEKEQEDKNKSYFRHLASDLNNTLLSVGVDDFFIHDVFGYSINPQKIRCDYYDYLKGVPYAVKTFKGEYMSRYSWAEATLGNLQKQQ